MYYIVIAGPAGSGKSYLTKALSEWIVDHKMDVTKVNLDPACDWLPYSPDVDVRNYVDAREVMGRYGLGPNGALLVSIDLLVNHISDIKAEIEAEKSNYVIIDTPGQLELLAFRRSGPIVLNSIIGDSKAVTLFLIDSFLALQPFSLISVLLYGVATLIQLGRPQLFVLSKADNLSDEKKAELLKLFEHGAESEVFNMYVDSRYVDYSLVSSLLEYVHSHAPPPIPVSSTKYEGLDELYAEIQRVLAGGEDYLTEEPSEAL